MLFGLYVFSSPLGVCKSIVLAMEDQPLRRSRRLQKISSSDIVEPPSPPQRQRLDTDGSFQTIGISEASGEPKLRTNQVDTTIVEIEYL